jgi:hypothetical protein
MGKNSSRRKTLIGIRLTPLEVQMEGNRKAVLEADVELVPEPKTTQSPSEPKLYNLGIRLVVWPDSNSVLDVRYGRLWGVNLSEAKAMYQKLAAVDRALNKMNHDLGWPADPADSFMRAVRAIGAEQVIETLDAERAEMTGEKYEFLDLGPATDRVRRMLQEAVAKLAAPPEAATPAPTATPA